MKRLVSLAAAILLLTLAGPARAQEQEPVSTQPAIQLLEDYFDLMLSGNLASAEGLWTQAALNRSSRFGITFSGIPLKVDASSPIVRNLPVMRDYLFPAVSQVNVLDGGNFVRLDFKKVVGGQAVEYPYYARYDGQYFWLTYPQDYFARDWNVLETKYYRIHYEPGTDEFLHPVLLEQADRYVEKVADSLKMAKTDVAEIADKKVEFFFCKSDSSVAEITGHFTKGTTDLASNDIISSYFPHNHELIHLLVNIKLRTLPLYTQPILREGLAVHFGGRWGKAPTSLVFLGAFLHENQIVEVDSIISMDRFESQAGADMAYPVAGLFSGYLIDRMGLEGFMQLYLALSGTFDQVSGMLAPAVKRTIYEAAGVKSWEALLADFQAYCGRLQKDRSVFAPGSLKKGKKSFVQEGMQVNVEKKWASLQVVGDSAAMPEGNLLFGYDKRLEGVRSMLFEEQYQGAMPYPAYRWGIRFDANEAGLYDYATNQLVGKYIFGITPSSEYHGEDGNDVAVRYLLDLSDGAVPTETDHKLLKN